MCGECCLPLKQSSWLHGWNSGRPRKWPRCLCLYRYVLLADSSQRLEGQGEDFNFRFPFSRQWHIKSSQKNDLPGTVRLVSSNGKHSQNSWIESFFRIFVVDDNPHSLPTLESWHSGRHFLHSEAMVPFQWVQEGPFTSSRGIPSHPALSPVSLTLATSQRSYLSVNFRNAYV